MVFNPARPFAGLERVDFTGLRLRLINADNQVCRGVAAVGSCIHTERLLAILEGGAP
jgi:hypothetical protein